MLRSVNEVLLVLEYLGRSRRHSHSLVLGARSMEGLGFNRNSDGNLGRRNHLEVHLQTAQSSVTPSAEEVGSPAERISLTGASLSHCLGPPWRRFRLRLPNRRSRRRRRLEYCQP